MTRLDNPYESPQTTTPIRSMTFGEHPSSLFGAFTQGVRLGVKWITYIIGPFALLLLIIAVGFVAYRICFVEGWQMFTNPNLRWEMLEALGSPFGLYLLMCVYGSLAGMIVCPVVYLFRRRTARSDPR